MSSLLQRTSSPVKTVRFVSSLVTTSSAPAPSALATSAPATSGWRTWPWRSILFLHTIFLMANVSLDAIPYPSDAAPTVDQIVSQGDQGMLGRRIAFIALGIVAAYSIWKFDYRRLRVRGLLGTLMLAFFIWSCMSLGWADDVPLVARKLLIFVLLWLGAGWAALRLSPTNLLRFGFFSNVLTFMTCVGIEVAFGQFRPWVGGYRLAGLYHPNETGQCLVVAVVAGIALATQTQRFRPRVLYIVAAFTCFLGLLITGSRTSLFSVCCGVATYWVFLALANRRAARMLAITTVLVAVGLCVAYLIFGSDVGTSVMSAATLGRTDSDITTLTLRTPMWHVLINQYIAARPFTGYGYGGFWSTKHLIAMSLLQKGTVYFHSHSGYLEMALSIGVIGAAVHVFTLLLGTTQLIGKYLSTRNQACAFGAAMLVTLMVSMFTEVTNMSSYLMPTFLDMAFLMQCAFVIAQPSRAPATATVPRAYQLRASL